MEISDQGELEETAASSTEQVLDCPDILSLNIFVFVEFEAPIDDIPIFSLVQDTVLTIPRLASIMVRDRKGVKGWKQVEVMLEDHIIEPTLFIMDMSIDMCTERFNEYISKIAMEQLPRSKPLWSLLRGTLVEDDITPIRSINKGIEFRPATTFNITFSLEHIKEIKSKLGVTVNDVITGIIFYGIRLYKQDIDYESRTKDSTILTMLSTREAESCRTTLDMQKSRVKGSLGIQVMLLHLSIPELKDTLISNPLQFVWKAHREMKKKKRSLGAAVLINKLQQITYWCKGPEAVAKLFHRSNRNSSLNMSNIIGPADQLAFGNYPIKNLYFTVSGHPQSLLITIMSYNGNSTVTTRCENGFMDHQKLASHVNNAFEMIGKAATEIPSN